MNHGAGSWQEPEVKELINWMVSFGLSLGCGWISVRRALDMPDGSRIGVVAVGMITSSYWGQGKDHSSIHTDVGHGSAYETEDEDIEDTAKFYDDVSGKLLPIAGVRQARKKLEFLQSFPVNQRVLEGEAKGKTVVSVRWCYVRKGDDETPNLGSRLVGREYKWKDPFIRSCRGARYGWEEVARIGFEIGWSNPCLYRHKTRPCFGLRHGDDLVFVGVEDHMLSVHAVLFKKMILRRRALLDVGVVNGVPVIFCEADSRDAYLIIEQLVLSTSSKGVLHDEIGVLSGGPAPPSHARWSQTFEMQMPVRSIDAYTDSDPAGNALDRKAVSCAVIMMVKHLIKFSVANQSTPALSSGEAEYVANVNGASMALRMRSMAQDFGVDLPTKLHRDSATSKGMASQIGLGKVCHLDMALLWLQHRVNKQHISMIKVAGGSNVANLGTKDLDAQKMCLYMK
eukprot:122618-Amphidinium_carterae.2